MWLPNDKFLNLSKLKAFAGNNIDLSDNYKFVLGRVKYIVGKGENAGNHKVSFLRLLTLS